MPGTRCCVSSCSNSLIKTKKLPGPQKIGYYSFPKDPKSRKRWLFKCKKGPDFNPHARVCSDHFSEDSFEDDMEARIMGLTRARKLKRDALPTENLTNTPTPQKKKEDADARQGRLEKRRSRQIVTELIRNSQKEDDFEMTPDSPPPRSSPLDSPPPHSSPLDSPPLNSPPPHSPPLDSPPPDSPANFVCGTCKNLNVAGIINEKEMLEGQVRDLKEEVEKLKMELENCNELEIVVVKNSSKEEDELKKLKDALQRVFTDEQINMLTNKKRRAVWSAVDMRRAFALRCLSKKAYLYMKNNMNIPLPGLSTLQFWASKKRKAQRLSQAATVAQPTPESLCVVVLDEETLE